MQKLQHPIYLFLATVFLIVAPGCQDEDSSSDDDTEVDAGVDDDETIDSSDEEQNGEPEDQEPEDEEPEACEAEDVRCTDDLVLELRFNEDEAAPGLISNQENQGSFISSIDATAGGFSTPNPHAYVYARFTDTGLEKVSIDDGESIDNVEWDIAFRRYLIRVNSGTSGPSCVSVARHPDGTTFMEAGDITNDADFQTENFFTQSCEIIADGGLGDPAMVIGTTYYRYSSCVVMNGNIYVIELADGRHVKAQILQYYEDGQDGCDENGTPGTGSGRIQMQWAFL